MRPSVVRASGIGRRACGEGISSAKGPRQSRRARRGRLSQPDAPRVLWGSARSWVTPPHTPSPEPLDRPDACALGLCSPVCQQDGKAPLHSWLTPLLIALAALPFAGCALLLCKR